MTEINERQYETWEDVEKDIFTPEEIAESDLRVALIGAMIKARQEKVISQRKIHYYFLRGEWQR